MLELSSMLVPLYTLPGWPTAPDPSALQVLGLLVGFPALAFVIIVALGQVSKMVKASRGGAPEATDPVWVGGHEDRPIGKDDSSHAQISAGNEVEDDQVGGASARW